MADLTVAGFFTENIGDPAVGLVLADIDIYLTEVDRATLADTVIWDGTQNPTEEVDNVGAYARIYTLADLDAYSYFAYFEYTGATVLDLDHVTGATGVCITPVGTAIVWPYAVLTPAPANNPIDGVEVQISTDLAGTNVIWVGHTDAFGMARDALAQQPRLDPGTYYFWMQRVGYTFTNPDTEVVA